MIWGQDEGSYYCLFLTQKIYFDRSPINYHFLGTVKWHEKVKRFLSHVMLITTDWNNLTKTKNETLKYTINNESIHFLTLYMHLATHLISCSHQWHEWMRCKLHSPICKVFLWNKYKKDKLENKVLQNNFTKDINFNKIESKDKLKKISNWINQTKPKFKKKKIKYEKNSFWNEAREF